LEHTTTHVGESEFIRFSKFLGFEQIFKNALTGDADALICNGCTVVAEVQSMD